MNEVNDYTDVMMTTLKIKKYRRDTDFCGKVFKNKILKIKNSINNSFTDNIFCNTKLTTN